MNNLSLIACISQDNGLGYKNQLLWQIPEDMAFFKKTTLGHPVVMGRRTFESMNCKPLTGRTNLVLSHTDLIQPSTPYPTPSAAHISSRRNPPTTLQFFHDEFTLDTYLSSQVDEIFIIGGATLYNLYLPRARKLYLTEVAAAKPADVFFPTFDRTLYKRRVLKKLKLDDLTAEIVEYTKKGTTLQ